MIEWRLFDNCFRRSIRAVRAPFNGELPGSDNFGDIAYRYRNSLENCFAAANQNLDLADFTPTLLDGENSE